MKPTESGRPQFSTEEAQALVVETWKLKGTARELPSERDQNFHIRAEGGAECVLKIANVLEKREVLELQGQAIRQLARSVPDHAWPEGLRTSLGEDIATTEHRSGTKHLVHLMEYF